MSSFYEGVKDSVRENNEDNSGKESSQGSGNSASYSTLKQAAEDNDLDEEKEKSETPIEVLDEGLNNQQSQQNQQRKEKTTKSVDNREKRTSSSKSQVKDTGNLEEKLDKIIEQNARMIEVLESFGN